jgi:hypothetical protein
MAVGVVVPINSLVTGLKDEIFGISSIFGRRTEGKGGSVNRNP